MKIIYISGKYSGETNTQVEDNIRIAEKAMIQLTRAGWGVFCPHKNAAHLDQYDCGDWDFWMEHSLEMLKRCDAIYMCSEWEHSKGAILEYNFAKENKIPIFYYTTKLPKPSEIDNHVY